MDALWLPRALLKDVRAHAAETAPEECVGLLLGREGRVSRTRRLTNASKSPQTRFFALPQELLAALKEADSMGEKFLGSYHSHPQSDAWLSPSDLAGVQAGIGTVQLIVGQDAVRAFCVRGGVGTELELELI